jgi:type I restriction enzyme S subunit
MLDKAKNRGTPQPYLRNVNVRWFGFDLSDLLEMRFEDHERERYTARKGDLLICEGGYPGRAAIWQNEEPVYFQKAVHRVRFHEPDRAPWVLYYLWASDADGSLKAHFTGSGIQHFTGQALARLKIPLPPLEEQRRIVVVLDEAFAAIATATANAEKNVANARETRALLHRRAFADIRERQALGELASFRNGVNFTSASRGEEVRIVGVKDFQSNLFVPDEDLATVRIDGTLPGDDLLRAGDILTVRSNGNKALIGRCMIAANVEERTTHSGFTIRIRAEALKVDPEYLCRYLKSPEARERLVAGGAGANISSLNQKVLASLPVPVPSVVDQRRIVGTLSEIDEWSESLEALSRAKLVQLAALKQSLLHRAFSGALTEREPLAA